MGRPESPSVMEDGKEYRGTARSMWNREDSLDVPHVGNNSLRQGRVNQIGGQEDGLATDGWDNICIPIWVVVKIMVPFLGPYYNTAPNI